MAAPNIVNVATITGKTAVQDVGTSPTAVVANGAASGKVLKINCLYAGAVDAVANGLLTVDFYRGSTATELIKKAIVPKQAALTPVLKDGALYLEEGDSLRVSASAVSTLKVICSYEEIS